MDTTLYKVNTTVNSSVNIKYLVIDKLTSLGGLQICVDFPNLLDQGKDTILEVLTYNSTLSGSSYGGNMTKPTNYNTETFTIGNDTVYRYEIPMPRYKTGTSATEGGFIVATAGCTKIMFKPTEGVHLRFIPSNYDDSFYINKASILDHYVKEINRTPLTSPYIGSETRSQTQVGIPYVNSLHIKGFTINSDLSDFSELYPYINVIDIYQSNGIVGDIASIANGINISIPMQPPYTCNGIRLYIPGFPRIYGDLAAFINTLLSRGARNLAGQIYFGDITNLYNNISTSDTQLCFYIDNNGNVSTATTVSDWHNLLPKNS